MADEETVAFDEWDSWVTPRSTGRREFEGTIRTRTKSSGVFEVHHPKDRTPPKDGPLTGNRIDFTIDHRDHGRRHYWGNIVPTPDGATIENGFYEPGTLLTEQSSEYGQDKKDHKRFDGDDGGWVATRPPT